MAIFEISNYFYLRDNDDVHTKSVCLFVQKQQQEGGKNKQENIKGSCKPFLLFGAVITLYYVIQVV